MCSHSVQRNRGKGTKEIKERKKKVLRFEDTVELRTYQLLRKDSAPWS
jgi:hypothetical protein